MLQMFKLREVTVVASSMGVYPERNVYVGF